MLTDGNLEQADLVSASGASHSVVSQWITGAIKSMSLKYALGIEARYGYNHIWLMINEGEPKASPGDSYRVAQDASPYGDMDHEFSDQLIELMTLFQQADSTGKNFILNAARSAKKSISARWVRAGNES